MEKAKQVKDLKREEKIQLLKNIEYGKASIHDLDPNTYVVRTFLDFMKVSNNTGINPDAIKIIVEGEMKEFFARLEERQKLEEL